MYNLQEFSFVKKSANNQTSRETLDVFIYEVAGDMNKLLHRAERYPQERNAYLGDLRGETSDAFCMLRMFIEQQGWDVYEIASLGEQRYEERMDDIRRLGLKERLKRRNDE
jgi:hypothetical protein